VLAAGHILDGRYEIISIIASGGMGSVYRARRTLLLDEVAVKVIRADETVPSVRERFMRESRASARLRHPNIVSILDFDIDSSGNPFLVMELLSGPSLKDEIAARRFEVADVQRIVPQLCNALQLAHSNGIRNGLLAGLTPDIMRVARERDEGDNWEERLMISTAGIWQAQDLLATLQEGTLRGVGLADDELRYVAPELLTGQAADVRSDVFTIGVLGYEMATGTLPYDAASMQQLLGAMLKGTPVLPAEKQPTLPAPASAALLRALRPVPDARFASAKEFATALFG
jgi:serine/threonine protein kinase